MLFKNRSEIMNNGILVISYALCISILLNIMFFSKKKVQTRENNCFKWIIVLNLVGLILELICNFSSFLPNIPQIIAFVLTKMYFCYLICWIFTFTIYIIIVSVSKYEEKRTSYLRIIYLLEIISSLIVIIAPVTLINNDGIIYAEGLSVIVTALISLLNIAFCLFLITFNIKKIRLKKVIPLIALIILGAVAMAIQMKWPSILIITCIETFICMIMYFTIENPDVKMLEQVSLAKEAAEKANHAKSDFLSNMSHEIRTPLNAIVGFSESLREDDIPDSSKEKVNDILIASNNLLEIVNGILDISKIEANKLEIINKEYEIYALFDEVTTLINARIGEKGLEFRVIIDQAIPKILYGDSVRLKQILINILTNAVKYTKEGFVELRVSSVARDNVCRLIMSVEDSGIGIKEESLDKLFSKFERLNVEKQLTIEGTGLGLAITKKLVDLMNGKIIVQSVYGKGSKFTVSIDQRIIPVEESTLELKPAAETKVVDALGARILLVDDNELNIKVASVLLKKYHFTIDTCTSGIECLAKIKNNEKYDIIFLDDMMPKMSGRETLRKLKELDNFNIPVIALTANAITGMKQEYLDYGFDDYLSKPIEKIELERIIKKYVNQMNNTKMKSNASQRVKSLLNDNFAVDMGALLDKSENERLDFDRKKVLVVDDSNVNLKIAEAFLKKYNLNVTSVSSGSKAIEKVIYNDYDLILLDEIMPDMNGLKTYENFKTIEGFKTDVVLMSSNSRDISADTEKAGFTGVLAKPINREDLEKLLVQTLKR